MFEELMQALPEEMQEQILRSLCATRKDMVEQMATVTASTNFDVSIRIVPYWNNEPADDNEKAMRKFIVAHAQEHIDDLTRTLKAALDRQSMARSAALLDFLPKEGETTDG